VGKFLLAVYAGSLRDHFGCLWAGRAVTQGSKQRSVYTLALPLAT